MTHRNVTIKLTGGQTFAALAARTSRNRYFDGVDWLYFETLDDAVPTVDGAIKYHDWTLTDGQTLTAWLVPAASAEILKNVTA